MMKVVVPFLLLFCCVGCVTSAQYQVGAHALGTDLSKDAQRYLNKDSSLDPTSKSTRQVQAQVFSSAIADVKSISRPTVVAAWKPVEVWYISYVNNDTKLDSFEKDLRNESIQRFDKLADDDAKRPFALFGK